MPRSSRPSLPHLLLLAGALLGALSTAFARPDTGEVLYLVTICLAATAACLAARTAAPAARPTARLGALGIVLYAAGDVIWTALDRSGLQAEISVADLFYLASYTVLGAMLVLLLMPRQSGRWAIDVDVLIDILSVVTVCLLVLWELGIRGAPGADTPDLNVVTYPIIDAVLIGLTVRVLTHAEARRGGGLLLVASLVSFLAGDYGYLLSSTGLMPQRATDAAWMAAVVLLGWAVTRVSLLPAPQATPWVGPSNDSRLALAILPLLVPPGLVVVEEALGRDSESWSLVVGTVVLIALAFVRTERLLASERRTLSELAVTRDAALQASRAKTAFLAGISHEIRTPMNGVLGLSRLLSATSLDDQQRGYAQGIETAGESLLALLNDVLDFAKFEAGPVETERLDFDVVELVEDVAGMVAEQAHHAGLELVAHLGPDLPRWLNGDPTRLRQVLLNYAANAVKFTAEGQVVIRADLMEDRPEALVVQFSVSDTGIGIAAQDQERLFLPFTQADASTTRRYGGTGLGLAIVRRVADALGGEVGVTSSPHRGSTFWCTVPLAPARRSHLISTRPTRAVPGTRALVVDDNATAREVLADQLRHWGLDVVTVPTALDALCALATAASQGTPYAVALIDQDMPGVDGLALAHRVRADPTFASVPLVLLTTGPGLPAEQLRQAGIGVRLTKPVQVSRLQGAVQRALGAGTAEELPVHARPPRDLPADRGVVLVVEDSEVNRLVAVGTLRRLGFLTEVAVNGADAVEAVSTQRFDAVLMDCRMPVLDGYDATREIRRREDGGPRTPIIAVTANASPEDRTHCEDAGMDDYLAKPLSHLQLAETLNRWVPLAVPL